MTGEHCIVYIDLLCLGLWETKGTWSRGVTRRTRRVQMGIDGDL